MLWFTNRNPNDYLFAKHPGQDNRFLWYPTLAEDFLAAQNARDKKDLAVATGDQLDELKEFNRVKCYYKDVGDERMVIMRKKRGYITFGMEEAPEVVQKVAKLWIANGGSASLLPPAMVVQDHNGISVRVSTLRGPDCRDSEVLDWDPNENKDEDKEEEIVHEVCGKEDDSQVTDEVDGERPGDAEVSVECKKPKKKKKKGTMKNIEGKVN